MTQLLTLAATFAVEEENAPDFGLLLAEVEDRMRQLDGVHGGFADLTASTRHYTVVVELEGNGVDLQIAADELDTSIREVVTKFSEEPRVLEPLVDEVG